MTLEIYVMQEEGVSFWKEKGKQAWSRNIVTMAKLIQDNKDNFIIKFGNDYN